MSQLPDMPNQLYLSYTFMKNLIRLHSKDFLSNVSLWTLGEQQHLRNAGQLTWFSLHVMSDTRRLTLTD